MEGFPAHFQDLRRTIIPLKGDIRTLTPDMVDNWRRAITEHVWLAKQSTTNRNRNPQTNEEKQQILQKVIDIVQNLKTNTPHTAHWQKWYLIDTTPQANSPISEGYNLIVNLRPYNGYRQITYECRIDNTTTLQQLQTLEERIQGTLSQESNDYGIHPRVIAIEGFRNWLTTITLPNAKEKLFSTTWISEP